MRLFRKEPEPEGLRIEKMDGCVNGRHMPLDRCLICGHGLAENRPAFVRPPDPPTDCEFE